MAQVTITLTDTPNGPRVRMEITGTGESRAVLLGLKAMAEIRKQQRERQGDGK